MARSLRPSQITGGCLCEALRYQIDFPEVHDFVKGPTRTRRPPVIPPRYNKPPTFQCIQDRKQTASASFFPAHRIPTSAFKWTCNSTSTLAEYRATRSASRSFCRDCGSFLFWTRPGSGNLSITIGSVDPLYLFGDGGGGILVPAGGYGIAALAANGGAGHQWCRNEIPGMDKETMNDYLHMGTRYNGATSGMRMMA